MTRAFLATALLALATPAVADEVENGRETFLHHCATCHGIEATGQGPMRPVLMVQPADLTQLTATKDGVFPLVRVIKRIDGRDPLVSHGSPMPVYGDFFEGDDTTINTDAGQPIMTSRPVVELVAYLRSMQSQTD